MDMPLRLIPLDAKHTSIVALLHWEVATEQGRVRMTLFAAITRRALPPVPGDLSEGQPLTIHNIRYQTS
jgi:hypothetical protein